MSLLDLFKPKTAPKPAQRELRFEKRFSRPTTTQKESIVNENRKNREKANKDTPTTIQNKSVNPTQTSFDLIRLPSTSDIRKNITLVSEIPVQNTMEFLCPIRSVKIYYKSVLTDKLGGLTKFIIKSLYNCYTLSEISALTEIGDNTLNEELQYLVKGGIIEGFDNVELTELGKDYGRLLEMMENKPFISAVLNTYADKIESVPDTILRFDLDEDLILEERFIPELTFTSAYDEESKKFVLQRINSDIPFSELIRKNLYTAIDVELKGPPAYKPIYLRQFSRGYGTDQGNGIPIAIPYEKVSYAIRVKKLDPYRKYLASICEIETENKELLSSEGIAIAQQAWEERNADIVELYINSADGDMSYIQTGLESGMSDEDKAIREAPSCSPFRVSLNDGFRDDIYIEELSREQLYKIQYFTYQQMEGK